MRRLVAPLLAVGAVLLVAALVWPTEHAETTTASGTVPLLDVWLWGRVRSLTQGVTIDASGSLGALTVLALSAVLAIAAGVLWVSATRSPATRRLRATLAVAGVAAALVVCVLGLTVMTADLGFGWYSYSEPTFRVTAVAAFPALAVALWSVALVLVVLLLRRPRGGAEGDSEGPSTG